MYDLEINPALDKILRKLSKRNPKQILIIDKKLTGVRENPLHDYKNLRYPLQEYKRIHIDRNFVLLFRINHSEKKIIAYMYAHHDEIYEN